MKRHQLTKYIFWIMGILVGLFFIWLYYSINPSGQSFIPKCPFHSITGLHCPGCGSQRALHDFLHGNIIEGFSHNLLIGLAILVLLYQCFIWIRKKYYPQQKNNLLYHKYTPWILLVVIVMFWVLRNIPHEPFCHLAP